MEILKIVIIGAGIAGLATALALQNRETEVLVFDKNGGLETRGAALTLWSNGTYALKKLHVLEEVLEHSTILSMGNIYSSRGEQLESLPIHYSTPTVGIPRYVLLRILADRLWEGTIVWNKKVRGLTETEVKFEDGTSVEADMVIAADGIHSIARSQLTNDSLRYSGYTSWRGISSIKLSSEYEGTMTQFWGDGIRFGFLPLKGGMTYWFMTANAKEQVSERDEVLRCVGLLPNPAGTILEGQDHSQIIHLDIYDRRPIPKWSYGNVLLLGDSAHPMTPSLGLGACMALEDAVCFSDCYSSSKSINQIYGEYEALRVPRANAIVQLSKRIGMVGQIQQPLLVRLRDLIYPMVPRKWKQRVWDELYGFMNN
ncbi:2-polyprenyl-6-methoxyphenol hydroxylase-like FAD-dependent oxidoreductase [Paenibacillus taihuensis]|uniref:2-polyprenyl-6-methoxyphenol hydroxylase-like FAD-dependent oxidoreductase n=1 Tax=Paenibacillus taihuensis TaxID=1156355 RepID=A0A3D9SJT0_9BACL|nr:FAD-dependent oxidoreductase [Paenibacillus taihuensis]REE94620.1 2-polyprenyl-6-methoxyphenol hydroxylase-like FAD-dependent oxidoreductase [Paenibacillus taihuensis]